MNKWGVIGCGGIADRRTIPEGILPSSKCELAAVMDVDAGVAAQGAARYGVPAYYNRVDDLLSLREVQTVYIASPNDCHRDQVIAAARAGKHVLVEKPVVLSITDADMAIEACGRNGVKLMAGYMMLPRIHSKSAARKALSLQITPSGRAAVG